VSEDVLLVVPSIFLPRHCHGTPPVFTPGFAVDEFLSQGIFFSRDSSPLGTRLKD
jgi:hypothetical protein